MMTDQNIRIGDMVQFTYTCPTSMVDFDFHGEVVNKEWDNFTIKNMGIELDFPLTSVRNIKLSKLNFLEASDALKKTISNEVPNEYTEEYYKKIFDVINSNLNKEIVFTSLHSLGQFDEFESFAKKYKPENTKFKIKSRPEIRKMAIINMVAIVNYQVHCGIVQDGNFYIYSFAPCSFKFKDENINAELSKIRKEFPSN